MSDNQHGSDLPRPGSDQSGSAPDAGGQEPSNSSTSQADVLLVPLVPERRQSTGTGSTALSIAP
jgi:hypothetical protein